ncbi:zinc finger protein draculin-like isoform X8 [Ostrinia nubilalis]|uniref:zinc finger protein draculin-like isoform X8 n=1 Tax=Ostrinia nubilalis TaxID=29057 RepID=UPI0030825C74
MAAKTTDWRPGPTVCRCCLSEGCYKDISTEYFWMGKREVYSEMLSETFSLSIAYSTSGGPNSNSRLICEPCISRLRDASDFKRQVQECEKTFMQYLDPGTERLSDFETAESRIEVTLESLETEVKVEQVKTEKDESDGDDFGDRTDFPDLDDDDDDLDDQPLTRLATRVPKKESVDTEADSKPEKRKATTKAKTSPAKKAKTKKEVVKATTSKAAKPTEKKKKGDATATDVCNSDGSDGNIQPVIVGAPSNAVLLRDIEQKRVSRDSAITLISYTNVCPFKFFRCFICLYCPTQFVNMQELRQHLDIQHQNLSENFIRKALVKKEKCQPIKINVLDYSCKLCNDEISNFEDLKSHLIGKHQKPIDLNNDGVLPYKITENEYICVLCETKFEQFELLNRHINKHYTKFICDQCGAGFASEARLRRHVESHKVGAYPCEECGKVFGKITTKQVHIQTVHLNAKKNKCMYCEELFKNYYQKQQHLLDAHGIKMRIFKCSLCPKIFSRSGSLRCHERYNHIKAQVFACELCEYQSHDKGTLRRHMICHSDEKKYKCEVCEKSYARLGTWKEHMKIHYNIRRFACQYCGRAFVQKCSLKGHLKTHHRDQMKEDNLQLDQV